MTSRNLKAELVVMDAVNETFGLSMQHHELVALIQSYVAATKTRNAFEPWYAFQRRTLDSRYTMDELHVLAFECAKGRRKPRRRGLRKPNHRYPSRFSPAMEKAMQALRERR